MNFVFNELCVSNLEAFSQNDFNRWLNNWLDLLAYSRQLFKEPPCWHSDFHKTELLPYPYMSQWMQTLSRDKCRLFLSLRDRCPCLQKNRDPLSYDEFLSSDFSYEGKTAKGLGAAYLLNGIAFSFPSDARWDTPYVNVQVYKINSNDCETASDAKVRHAIRNEHLDIHKQYMGSLDACQEKVSDLALLQQYWADEFPRLVQSNTVFDRMKKTTLNKHFFAKIVENLFKLNQFLDHGETDIRKLGNCSDESDTTKQKYGKTREFMFGTVRRRCYLHLKLWEMNWRIQFEIDYDKRTAYVGAIGEHGPI